MRSYPITVDVCNKSYHNEMPVFYANKLKTSFDKTSYNAFSK